MSRTETPRSPRRLASVSLIALSATLLVAGASCTENERTDAQPAPDVSTFAPGGFDDLPRFPDSNEAGTRSEEGDIVTQSFTVSGTSREEILDFYEEELVGWDAAGRVEAGTALREEFLDDEGNRLEVSTIVDSRGGLDVTQTIQYSLVLRQ